jgi:hypothetical protein
MSCSEAGLPSPKTAGRSRRRRPDGSNPWKKAWVPTRCYALRAGLFRELSDALDYGRVALPSLAGAGLQGLGFEGHRDSGSNHDSN